SRLHLESIEPCGVGLEDLGLGRITNIFSALNFSYRKGLTVAMRHVRTKNHVFLPDELNHLRQKNIVRFCAKEEISFADIIHWRKSRVGGRWGVERQKLISRPPKAVVQSLKHKITPLAPRL